MSRRKRPRVLAVASGGGHWVQLLRLAPAFEGCRIAYITVQRSYREDVPGSRFYVVNDATRWNKAALAFMALRILWVILRERPGVVVSTGAAPGYFAIRMGRLLGARTLWIDSIANADEVSMTGRLLAGRADLCLTQWPHLAGQGGFRHAGGVL